jgi:AcrR family transcriptional regulator
MRIAETVGERLSTDLTARARIRDAAIDCFADNGFDAPFRAIAARADVSPGLITHHFGSKAALRAECDAEVLRRYRAVKADAVARPSAHLLEGLTAPGASANVLVYILRAIHAGGASGRDFLGHLMDDARPVMADAVASGLVRRSRDEEARLRYLTYQILGAMLVQFLMAPAATAEEFVASLHTSQRDTILPMLELLTEGMLADPRLLNDYLGFQADQPTTQ